MKTKYLLTDEDDATVFVADTIIDIENEIRSRMSFHDEDFETYSYNYNPRIFIICGEMKPSVKVEFIFKEELL